MAYYVRDAKWINNSSKSQFSGYTTLQVAKQSAISLLNNEYYDSETVPIFVKKGNRYVIHSYVRYAKDDGEGEDWDIPTGNYRYVYRTPSGIEYLMAKNGDLSKTHWKAYFRITDDMYSHY